MLKNEKSVNRIEHQNRETEVFWHKNRKTDQKNIQNRKTENPNAPSIFRRDREPSSELGKKQRNPATPNMRRMKRTKWWARLTQYA